MKTLAPKIRDILHERKMTQKTLSELTNIPKSTICRILGEDSDPSLDQAAEIFKALGVSLDLLLGISDGSSKATPEIADTAINAYSELIVERDKNIDYLKQLISDKERIIETKDKVILVQEKLIEQLTERLSARN